MYQNMFYAPQHQYLKHNHVFEKNTILLVTRLDRRIVPLKQTLRDKYPQNDL